MNKEVKGLDEMVKLVAGQLGKINMSAAEFYKALQAEMTPPVDKSKLKIDTEMTLVGQTLPGDIVWTRFGDGYFYPTLQTGHRRTRAGISYFEADQDFPTHRYTAPHSMMCYRYKPSKEARSNATMLEQEIKAFVAAAASTGKALEPIYNYDAVVKAYSNGTVY